MIWFISYQNIVVIFIIITMKTMTMSRPAVVSHIIIIIIISNYTHVYRV